MRKNTLMILTIAILIGSANNIFAGFNINAKTQEKVKVGLLEFLGETSKVNQNSIRKAMAKHLNSKGFSTSSSSKGEREKTQYFIGVELRKSDKSQLNVIIALYNKDKKVVRQVTKSKGGIADDSVRTAGGTDDDSLRKIVLAGLDELVRGIR